MEIHRLSPFLYPCWKISWQSIVWSGPGLAMSSPASLEVRTGSDLTSVSIPRQKSLYVSVKNFFHQFRKIHSLVRSF